MKQICYLWLLLTYISSMVLLQSCEKLGDHKCPDTEIINRNLSASDLSKVPYTGFDTLYFLNKQGDTCIVRGTGKQYGTEVETPAGDPACPPEKRYVNQFYTINFVAVKGNLDFTLAQKVKLLAVTIDRASYSTYFFSEYNLIDKVHFYSEYYIDSIRINDKTYNRVKVFLEKVKYLTNSYDTTYRLLYNKPFGILYMKSEKENEEFSIIPKP